LKPAARQILGAIALALILFGGFEPFYLRVLAVDRGRLERSLVELPYQKMPGLRRFLLEVRRTTERGEVVALLADQSRRTNGYDYIYDRSLYTLAGRHVVAAMDREDRLVPDAIAKADVIAVFRQQPAIDGFRVVWSGPDGSILRRIR
jgi:hypothetical protein